MSSDEEEDDSEEEEDDSEEEEDDEESKDEESESNPAMNQVVVGRLAMKKLCDLDENLKRMAESINEVKTDLKKLHKAVEKMQEDIDHLINPKAPDDKVTSNAEAQQYCTALLDSLNEKEKMHIEQIGSQAKTMGIHDILDYIAS